MIIINRNNGSLERKVQLIHILVGAGFVMFFLLFISNMILSYSAYEECIKTKSKMYCLNALQANQRVTYSEIGEK